MRPRNEALRTGRLCACFHPEGSQKPKGILFLIEGTNQIKTLIDIEQTWHSLAADNRVGEVQWFNVPDRFHLGQIDYRLEGMQITLVEVAELATCSSKELQDLLSSCEVWLESLDGEPCFPAPGSALGAPAQGVQFLGRREELQTIIASLHDGKDIQLRAPRRTGKTSVLRYLERHPPGGLKPAFWDLQRMDCIEDNVAILASHLLDLPIRETRRSARGDWLGLLAKSLDGCRLLLVDELAFFLRKLEQNQKDLQQVIEILFNVLDPLPIRLVLADSEPLYDFLLQRDINKQDWPKRLREMKEQSLDPLNERPIDLRRLLIGAELVVEPSEMHWLQDHVDLTLPYPALGFLEKLRNTVRREGLREGATSLDGILASFLKETDAFAELDRYISEKGREGREVANAIDQALDALSGDGIPESQLRQNLERGNPEKGEALLTWLSETFPIKKTDSIIRISSKLFAAWWQYGSGQI